MVIFCNEFGILPSKNFEAAGYDFHIPNINDDDVLTVEQRVIPALCKSYNISEVNLRQLNGLIQIIINDRFYADTDDDNKEEYDLYRLIARTNRWNCTLLILSLSFKTSTPIIDEHGILLSYNITKLIYDKFIFDTVKMIPGLILHKGDSLFINSGIREKLPSGYAGIFMNKSGRASSGYDVGACVVDEDYTGYVALNLFFRGNKSTYSEIYCGDKIVQQLILPLYNDRSKEVTHDEFNKLTLDSKRGDAGFGSSNEKH